MQSYDRLWIGGEWEKPRPARRSRSSRRSPRKSSPACPRRAKADVDRAVAAAREAFDEGPWPRIAAAERADVMRQLLRALQSRAGDLASTITAEMGSRSASRTWARCSRPTWCSTYYAKLARDLPVRRGPRRHARPGARAAGAGRRRRRHRAVERAAVHDHAEARARARRRLARSSSSRRPKRRSTPTCSPRRSTRPASRRASSTSSPPAARSASTWSRIRASTRSPSPAAPRPAARSRPSCGERLRRVTLELGGKSAAIVLDDAELAAAIPPLLPAPAP